jgi:hypothetical protein
MNEMCEFCLWQPAFFVHIKSLLGGYNTMMLQNLERNSPIFGFQRRLFQEETESQYDEIIEKTDQFLDQYCEFHKLEVAQVGAAYDVFQKQYSSDLKAFNTVSDYNSVARDEFSISREEYDIALILSVVVSVPRCRIMQAIANFTVDENVLIVGVGSGLELSFLKEGENFQAYDLALSAFAQKRFPYVSFHTQEYASADNKYSAFLAIELLEHIEAPYPLLGVLLDSLGEGGRGMFTTCLNLPQFDHLYNFEDELEVETFVAGHGCRVVDKATLPHQYHNYTKAANNIIWTVER